MRLYEGLSFKNTTGSAIQAGAAMELTGSVAEAGEVILTVQQPTTAGIGKKLIVFNGPVDIPNNGGGTCQFGPLAIAVASGSPAIGTQVGPSNASWVVSSSGSGWVCLGPEPTGSFPNGVLLLAMGGGSMKPIRFQLSGSLSGGSAPGDVWEMDGTTVVESGGQVLDPENIFWILGSGNRGIGISYNGKHYVFNARCPNG